VIEIKFRHLESKSTSNPTSKSNIQNLKSKSKMRSSRPTENYLTDERSFCIKRTIVLKDY